ncbi:unnamed protein product [Pylaiella littoralis]
MVLMSRVLWTSGVLWVPGLSTFSSVHIGFGLLHAIRVRVPLSCVDFGAILAGATSSAVFSGSVNPGAFDEIHRACNDIPVNKKIFVRGLPWETTDQSLRAVFEQYGEIAEATVVMDKMTQKSKGYGFVTFKGMDGAHAALENPEKMIDGRVSLCNLAALRSSQPLPQRGPGATQGGGMQGTAVGMLGGAVGGSEDVSARKIFVRGLSWDTTTESLRTMFSQYGELEDAVVTTDRASGKSKGYGFITYRFAASAAAAVAEPEKQLDGRLTHCNIAAEGASNRNKNQNFGGGLQAGQWGMMGQQQYPAQGQGAGQWGAAAGAQAQAFAGQGQWGQQQQFGAAQGVQGGYGSGVQAGYGNGAQAATYGTNGAATYGQAAGQAAGGAGAWGGQQQGY